MTDYGVLAQLLLLVLLLALAGYASSIAMGAVRHRYVVQTMRLRDVIADALLDGVLPASRRTSMLLHFATDVAHNPSKFSFAAAVYTAREHRRRGRDHSPLPEDDLTEDQLEVIKDAERMVFVLTAAIMERSSLASWLLTRPRRVRARWRHANQRVELPANLTSASGERLVVEDRSSGPWTDEIEEWFRHQPPTGRDVPVRA